MSARTEEWAEEVGGLLRDRLVGLFVEIGQTNRDIPRKPIVEREAPETIVQGAARIAQRRTAGNSRII